MRSWCWRSFVVFLLHLQIRGDYSSAATPELSHATTGCDLFVGRSVAATSFDVASACPLEIDAVVRPSSHKGKQTLTSKTIKHGGPNTEDSSSSRGRDSGSSKLAIVPRSSSMAIVLHGNVAEIDPMICSAQNGNSNNFIPKQLPTGHDQGSSSSTPVASSSSPPPPFPTRPPSFHCFRYIYNGKSALVRTIFPIIPKITPPSLPSSSSSSSSSSPSATPSAPPSLSSLIQSLSFNSLSGSGDETVPDRRPLEVAAPEPYLNETYYFEITVGDKKMPLDAVFAIGLVPTGHNPTKLPGLDQDSFAVHGDDGRCYAHNRYKYCTQKWSGGDVVGVGIDRLDRKIFLTRNGVHQGVVFDGTLLSEAAAQDLHLALGVTASSAIFTINEGPGGFMFDPKRELNTYSKVNQLFTRFDINGDDFLDFPELKKVIRSTSYNPNEPFNNADYVRFCRLTDASVTNGMDAGAFYRLYEMNFGDIDEDYSFVTTNSTRYPLRSVSSKDIAVSKSGPLGIMMTATDVATSSTVAAAAANTIPKIDGGWSDWGECSHVCGYVGVRKRTCTEPKPQGMGADCEGKSVEPCNRHRCYDGAEWTDWTPCSTTCGPGVQYRSCLTDTLAMCDGPAVRVCKNHNPCDEDDYVHVDEMTDGSSSWGGGRGDGEITVEKGRVIKVKSRISIN